MLKFLIILNAFEAFAPPEQDYLQAKIEKEDFIDINVVYMPDPLAVFKPPRESTDEIIQRNEIWKHVIGNRVHQIKFVTSIINTNLVIPWVPKFGDRIDSSNDCWVFMVYNSDKERHYGGIRTLLSSMNAYFYERCGVSSIDLAYPSNLDTFGDIIETTPAVLYKSSRAPMINQTMFEIDGQLGSMELNPIELWGKIYDYDALVNDTVYCLEEINSFYEKEPDEIKLGSLFMEHYMEIEKIVLKNLYMHTIKGLNREAIHAVLNDTHWSEDAESTRYLSKEDKEAHDQNVQYKIIEKFREIISLKSVREHMRDNLKRLDTKVLVENGVDVRKIRKVSLEAHPQPDLEKIMTKWFEVYANDKSLEEL